MKYLTLLFLLSCGQVQNKDSWYDKTMADAKRNNAKLDSLLRVIRAQAPFRDTAFYYSKIRHKFIMKSLDELNKYVKTGEFKHRARYERWDDSADKYTAIMNYYYTKMDSINH